MKDYLGSLSLPFPLILSLHVGTFRPFRTPDHSDCCSINLALTHWAYQGQLAWDISTALATSASLRGPIHWNVQRSSLFIISPFGKKDYYSNDIPNYTFVTPPFVKRGWILFCLHDSFNIHKIINRLVSHIFVLLVCSVRQTNRSSSFLIIHGGSAPTQFGRVL